MNPINNSSSASRNLTYAGIVVGAALTMIALGMIVSLGNCHHYYGNTTPPPEGLSGHDVALLNAQFISGVGCFVTLGVGVGVLGSSLTRLYLRNRNEEVQSQTTSEDVAKERSAERVKIVSYTIGFLVLMFGLGMMTGASVLQHQYLPKMQDLVDRVNHDPYFANNDWIVNGQRMHGINWFTDPIQNHLAETSSMMTKMFISGSFTMAAGGGLCLFGRSFKAISAWYHNRHKVAESENSAVVKEVENL